jgi:prevent-host-death family protein
MEIAAGQFKARCLKLMNDVSKFHIEIVITKRGHPIARLVPIAASPKKKSWIGALKGQVKIHGDIVSSVPGVWDAGY